MTAFPEALARAWCTRLASTLPSQDIAPKGTPYLTRYFLAGWNPITKRPGPAVFLHRFVNSDPSDEVHSHPWAWSASLILAGGYREHRCRGEVRTVTTFRPGDVNVIGADDLHRIELLEAECWTLFLVGDFAAPWGFAPAC
jgi:hypothetical protein